MPDALILHEQAIEQTQRPDQSPAAVYIARLAPRSRRVMASALNTIADMAQAGSMAGTFPWHRLDYAHTQALRSQLAARYAPATANRMLSALRACLKEAWRLGLMPVEQMERASDLRPVRGSRVQKGKAVASSEMSALFATCNGLRLSDLRDACLLSLLYGCGLRRSEAVGLDIERHDADDGTLLVRGKGNKERVCYLADFAVERLDAWLRALSRDSGPIFVRVRVGDRLTDERLTDEAVRVILEKRCEQAGVQTYRPHDMRRTFVGDLLDAGVDLSTVQQMAGHSSPNTTARYDRRGDERKRRAAQHLQIG